MTRARILYWKEIPVQVQAEDASGQVSRQLDDRFQQGADAIAMFDGSYGNDDYLLAWDWGEYRDVEGSSDDVAAQLANHLNQGFPQNFVARVHDLHGSGQRDPRPGAVDGWCNK